jgi:adhesin transport system membrane fusion protein
MKSILPEKHKRNTQILFISFSLFALTTVLWMLIFNIDIISNAEGQVIPAGDVKTIQHLEGGIIDQILIKESDIVKKEDPLVILAATASEVDVDEAQVQIDAKIIESIRLEAEINDFDIPIFSDELVNNRPELVNKSMELFVSRKNKLEGDIKEVSAGIFQHQTAIDILIKQTEMSEKLLNEGIITEFAHLDLLKELNAAKGALEAALEEKENITKEFIEEARNSRQIAQREISELNETIKALKDNLDRTVITAPVDGVVKNLFFVTIGGVIRPGEAILDIVPTKDNLIVKARLQESDIGFVKPGQSAVVKLSSADAVNFGQIDGKVDRISPDTEQDENDNRIVFYNIFVELDQNYFESKEKIYYLVPGVKVTASIQIGERTLANYLLSPFIGSLGQSFQER